MNAWFVVLNAWIVVMIVLLGMLAARMCGQTSIGTGRQSK
jgi:hypothetical protein